ncbi:MAG: hypothetical protein NT024_01305 [Proteobacteria bacterium]|nr:hypothetical protein [Pseudomonadota bacterium]
MVLVEKNSMTVTLDGPSTAALSIRVKQVADIELHVQSGVHFNTNVANFDAAREFYGKLGFTTLTGFPDTNTQAMARAIGIQTPTAYDGSRGEEAGGYLLHGELVGPGGFTGGLIDLIEFTIPKNDEPPYAQLNHLGMARAAMQTTNIAADYQYMKSIGVDFISAPTSRSDGTKFAIFRDLEGTHYELIEVPDQDGADDEETKTTLSLTRWGLPNRFRSMARLSLTRRTVRRSSWCNGLRHTTRKNPIRCRSTTAAFTAWHFPPAISALMSRRSKPRASSLSRRSRRVVRDRTPGAVSLASTTPTER